MLKAQSLGVDTTLLNVIIERSLRRRIDKRFSAKKEVDDAMREGEAALRATRCPKRLRCTNGHWLLDPKLYEARSVRRRRLIQISRAKKAGEWFARAITINPDRETAYRYWGDSLMKQGRVTEAGDKFVEAYIAEPYSRLARAGVHELGEKSRSTGAS